MTPREAPSAEDPLGPIDLLVVEFPDGHVTAEGFDRFLELERAGTVNLLDVEFVAVDLDGRAQRCSAREVSSAEDLDLAAWEAASIGVIDDEDLEVLEAELHPGSVAVIVIYENRWLLAAIDGWCRRGARVVIDEGVHAADLVAALDADDAA